MSVPKEKIYDSTKNWKKCLEISVKGKATSPLIYNSENLMDKRSCTQLMIRWQALTLETRHLRTLASLNQLVTNAGGQKKANLQFTRPLQ